MSKTTDHILETLEQTGRNLIKQQIEHESMNSEEAEQLLTSDPDYKEWVDKSEKEFIASLDEPIF